MSTVPDDPIPEPSSVVDMLEDNVYHDTNSLHTKPYVHKLDKSVQSGEDDDLDKATQTPPMRAVPMHVLEMFDKIRKPLLLHPAHTITGDTHTSLASQTPSHVADKHVPLFVMENIGI